MLLSGPTSARLMPARPRRQAHENCCNSFRCCSNYRAGVRFAVQQAMNDRLGRYREMRDFSVTPEPRGKKPAARKRQLRYYIQRHAATRLHYDFRLELDGVLKSWAVP